MAAIMPVTTLEVFLVCPLPTTPHPTVLNPATTPAVRATRTQAIVGEAAAMEEAVAAAEATSGLRLVQGPELPRDYSRGFLDSFQFESSISLESLEKAVFPFASRPALN